MTDDKNDPYELWNKYGASVTSRSFPYYPATCSSTHGGAGYWPGSYWDGDAIVCGGCGVRIENPPPTGQKRVRARGLRGLFGGYRYVPTWPEWISHKRP